MTRFSVTLLLMLLGTVAFGQEIDSDPTRPLSTYYPNPRKTTVVTPALQSKIDAAKTEISLEIEASLIWDKAREAFFAATRDFESKSRLGKAWDEWANHGESRLRFENAAKALRTAAQGYREQMGRTDETTREAIEAVTVYYRLNPGLVRLPGTESLGLAEWQPQFNRAETFDKGKTRGRLKTQKEIKSEEAQSPLGPVSAFTQGRTGAVWINQSAFESSQRLAGVLYHETFHWLDISQRGGIDSREMTPEVKFRLVTACVWPDDEQVCNDSMTTIKTRWSDRVFRNSLYLTEHSQSNVARCVETLIDRANPPRDYAALRLAGRRFWKDYRKRQARKAREDSRKSPPDAGNHESPQGLPTPRSEPPRDSDAPYIPRAFALGAAGAASAGIE